MENCFDFLIAKNRAVCQYILVKRKSKETKLYETCKILIFGLDPPTVKGGVLYFKTELSVHFSLLKMSTLLSWNSMPIHKLK